jgi:EpsD family peptidyl-prolyl cis-trans isomerase
MGPKAPKGQVVAVVDGKEITQLELQAELAGVSAPDAKTRKAQEQNALQQIIARRVIADAARQQKLDKTPEFAIQEKRATDVVLAQMLEQKLVASVPTPTAEEAQHYIADNPQMFAQRKIYQLDTIRMPQLAPAVMKGLGPLNTMGDVDSYLTANHVPHARAATTLDTLTGNPKLTGQVAKLPAGVVFIYTAAGSTYANQVRDTQESPVAGDLAQKQAAAMLKQQRTQLAVQRQLQQYLAQAKGNVQYNPDYAPPAAPAKPAAPAPAASAVNPPKPG